MLILVTGAAGMLGHRVVDVARERGHEVVGADIAECDLTDAAAVDAFVREVSPEAIVNCAAYTDVDRAEEDEATALAVNGDAAGHLARAATVVGARLVHVSTDYVFDGSSPGRPYVESDPTGPIGAYGRTKLAGEEQVLAAGDGHAIVRTAWLFGTGGPNFPDTMLRLAQDRDEVAVVTDQVGCPTWAGHLAPALVDVAQDAAHAGVFHGAGGGQCSWFQLAEETFRRAGAACRVTPTDSAAFRRPAPRPAWSVLGTERTPAVVLPPWQEGLQGHLDDVKGTAS